MYTTKTISEAFARALYHGFATSREAIAWVDSVITSVDEPHTTLIDASLSGTDRPALISALHALPGEPDPRAVARLLIGHMRRSLEEDPLRAQEVAHMLFRMAVDDDFPEESAAGAMWSFDDDLDLATSGSHGDPEQIRRELVSFLAEYGDALEPVPPPDRLRRQ